jgi:hypothetical protein
MAESRKWRPEKWTKAIVRRHLERARRHLFRLAFAAEDPQEAQAIGRAVWEIDTSEMALEATECSSISITLASIGNRMRSASDTKTIPATSVAPSTPDTREPKTATHADRSSTPALPAPGGLTRGPARRRALRVI